MQCHVSFVTCTVSGLHVESHGFVGNYMYDEDTGRNFDLLLQDEESFHPAWWESAEPFYATAQKQVRTKCIRNYSGISVS